MLAGSSEAPHSTVVLEAQVRVGAIDLNQLIIRSAYLIVGGGVLGYLAEEEKQRRGEAASITRVLSNVRADANLWTTFETIAAEVSQLVGAERLTWGSDVTQSAGSYAEMVALARDAVRDFDATTQQLLLAGTVARVYGLAS